MTLEFDPTECARLIVEALEDDESMSAAPWSSCDDDMTVIDAEGELVIGLLALSEDHPRIARSRNNLRAMAIQLKLACAEIAKRTDERDVARWADDTRRKTSEALIVKHNALRDEYSAGSLTQSEAVEAARNVGVDITCGECASCFYTGYSVAPHDETCKTETRSAIKSANSGSTDQTELEALRESVGEQMRKLAQTVLFDTNEHKRLDATVRGLVPVWEAADNWRAETATNDGFYLHESEDHLAEVALVTAVDLMNSAITPEIAEILARSRSVSDSNV